MKYSNSKYLQFISIVLIALFIEGCSGGGGENGDTGSENQAPVAVAGADQMVSRNFNVSLDGNGSSDADGDNLTFTWTQTAGTDVTGGDGNLSGEAPAFAAPSDVGTLVFELVVSDGQEDSLIDTVVINVLEDVNVAYFVDGDNGNDETGVGTQENPFASIAKALCEVTPEQQDLYVMTRTGSLDYNETIDSCPGEPARSAEQILAIPVGTSLYGGYDENWTRDAVNNPASVNTLHHGFLFTSVDLNAWFSGFKVKSGDSPDPESSVYALSALGGTAGISIHDNELTAGDVAIGNASSPGTSYGLRVALMETATIERNIISAGFGGDGLDLDIVFATRNTQGSAGSNASAAGGAGGDGKGSEDYDGGAGGNRSGGPDGFCISPAGTSGATGQGSAGGSSGARGSSCGANGGGGGLGGNGGTGGAGAGGNSSGGIDVYEEDGFFASFVRGNGIRGNVGGSGHGGGGGGGGSESLYYYGGSGGGGGGGGAGGAGGTGGDGGGASIGLFIASVTTVLIDNNEITSGPGGNGKTGGRGQQGGLGGLHGNGVNTDNVAGNGGNGGDGGDGGWGGRGGAGGGGPSYGIAISGYIAPTVSNNVIRSGNGGIGGDGGDGGNAGSGGNSYAVYDFNTNDDIIPLLSNNDSSYAVPGDGGSGGDAGESGVKNW